MHLEIDIASFTFHLGMAILGIVFWLLIIGLIAVVLVGNRVIEDMLSSDDETDRKE